MGYERGRRLGIKTLVSRARPGIKVMQSRRIPGCRPQLEKSAMSKKIYGALAFGATVMLALTFAELRSASAIHDQDQRPEHRQAAGQHRRAAQRRVRTRKENRRRRLVHYVCPMHPDIRSKSHGTCPKCLMDLVAEKRGAKTVRH